MNARPVPTFDRIGSIDALRAVMAAGIALYHFVPLFFVPGDTAYWLSRFGACFTDMFFIFAGLFVARGGSGRALRSSGFSSFLLSRLARLYPLHLATLLFYVALGVAVTVGALHTDRPERYDWSGLLPNLTLTHAWGLGAPLTFNYPSWAVSAILGCYLVMPLFALAGQWRDRLLLAALVASVLVALAAGIVFDASVTDLQRFSWGGLRAMPSFLFGLVLYRWRPVVPGKAAAAAALVVALLLTFAHPVPLEGLARLAAVNLLVAAIIAADGAKLWTPLSLRSLQALGRFSFGVYLLHSVIATLLLHTVVERMVGGDLFAFAQRAPVAAYWVLAGGVVLSFAAAALSHATIEKYGARMVLAIARRRPVQRPMPG